MKKKTLEELAAVFFAVRQTIKQQLPLKGKSDPNTWLRLETLRFIAGAENPTMRDVAAYLHIKAPSATSLVAHLAKGGFVTRQGEKGDKRVVRILLTARGKQEIKRYNQRFVRLVDKIFSRLDERELQNLTEIFRRLHDVYQK